MSFAMLLKKQEIISFLSAAIPRKSCLSFRVDFSSLHIQTDGRILRPLFLMTVGDSSETSSFDTLQATVHALWRERNKRRHGATARDIGKVMDRQVRNRCLSFRQLGEQKYAGGLSLWLATR